MANALVPCLSEFAAVCNKMGTANNFNSAVGEKTKSSYPMVSMLWCVYATV